MRRIFFNIFLLLFLCAKSALAVQTGTSIDSFGGNVGIGTVTPQGALTVTNGNVGIGTWVPTQLLDVMGTAKAVAFIGDGSGLSNVTAGWAAAGSNIYLLTATNNVGLGTTTPQGSLVLTSGNMGIATWAPATLLQINRPAANPFSVTDTGNVGLGTITPQGALVITSGNVGIGTWSPLALFQVNAPANNVFVVTSGGNVGLSTTTPQTKMAIMGNVGIGTWTAAGGSLIVRGGGNVGINTAWPGTSLDVNGTFRVSNGGADSYFMTNVGVNSLSPGRELDVSGTIRATAFVGDGSGLTGIPAGGGWTTSGTNVYLTTSTNNVGIGTTTPQAKLAVLGNMGIGTWTAGDSLIVRGGNVGFGVNSPNRLLYLAESTAGLSFALKLDNYNATSASTGILFSVDGAGGGASDTSRGKGALVYTNDEGGWNRGSFNFLQDQNNNTNIPDMNDAVMIIKNGGNIGIGTTNPQGKLIIHQGNFGIGVQAPNRQMYVASTASGLTYPIKIDNYNTTAQTGILFAVNGSGGGTIDTSRGKGSLVYAGTNTFNRGDFHILQDANADSSNPDMNDSVMVIRNDGNVGIGTITPMGLLVVAGGGIGIGTNKNSSFIRTAPSAGHLLVEGNIGLGTTTPLAKLAVISGNVGIGTWTAAGGALIVNGGGNVGISSAWPGATLDVSGTIRGTRYASPKTLSNGTNTTALGSVGGSLTTTIIHSSGQGSLAMGFADDSGVNRGRILSSNSGSVAFGYAVGNGSAEALISSSGFGSFAGGYADGGSITASGGGSLAYGYSSSSSDVILSSGNGSVALGQGVTASAANSLALGKSVVNNNSSTFMVGFNAVPTLTVTSANVGIGTITPSSKLVVSGGGVGIGTNANSSFIQTSATLGGLIAEGNVGLGTTTPQSNFISMGNVGIGTWSAAGGNLIIRGGGNVGIGSAWPGTTLDVQGTVRAVAFSGDGALLTNVPVGGGTGWTPSGSNVYITTNTNNVGIGTTAPQAKLVVFDGNVGIGTWTATNGALIVKGGNVGIGTALAPTTLSLKGSVSQVVVNNADAASVTTDASLGNYFRWTATQNFTLANPTNPTDGQKIVWEIIQDGTGNRTINLDTKFALGTDVSSVALSTGANKKDFLTAIYNAVADKWYVVGFLRGY